MVENNPNQYFEGILQLRNPNEEILNAVYREVERKGDVSIAKIIKIKNGLDVYISSQRFLRTLGNKLQSRFGGQLTISTKLHTKNRLTSKEVHRVNVLFKLHNFKKGDIIEYKGDKIKIIGMQKKVLAKHLKSGKKLTLNFKDLIG